MFITTQHGHTIAAKAYKQPPLRTGFEPVMASRNSKIFCSMAPQDGVVKSMGDHGLIVKYADGTEEGFPLGRQYGKAEGTAYPFTLKTRLKEGEKFKAGDNLAYNEEFYEPDVMNPKTVISRLNGVALVAFNETKSNHEDSSCISKALSSNYSTRVAKQKSLIVKFTDSLNDVVKVGMEVTPTTPLMIIEDDISSGYGNFKDRNVETLKRLSAPAPKAGVRGIVDSIEIIYHGDKREMSPSLRKLADASDKLRAAQCQNTGNEAITGATTSEYRVSGKPLEKNTAEIKISINISGVTGVGDKIVIGHQMKCTIAEVMPNEIRTEDGQAIDVTFSYRGMDNRGVTSPMLTGTTMRLQQEIARRAVKRYKGDLK